MRRPSGWWPSVPPWSNASPTSPSCGIPKATSSAWSWAPAAGTRRRVGEDGGVCRDVDWFVDVLEHKLRVGMASTTVRVSEHTHDLLRKMAEATGEPLQKGLERAVENYRRERFFAELNEAYARLQADPVAWEEELAERALWETTLPGGLDDWGGPFAAAKSGGS